MAPARKTSETIPMRQRDTPKRLSDWLRECGSRDEPLWMAHTRSGLRMTALAAELGLLVARVSQVIAEVEADRRRGSRARPGLHAAGAGVFMNPLARASGQVLPVAPAARQPHAW